MSRSHKKKALVLFGPAPGPHGHTAQLLDSFLECFRHHDGWEVEVADLYRQNPHPCTGCKACAKEEALRLPGSGRPGQVPAGLRFAGGGNARCTTFPSPRR